MDTYWISTEIFFFILLLNLPFAFVYSTPNLQSKKFLSFKKNYFVPFPQCSFSDYLVCGSFLFNRNTKTHQRSQSKVYCKMQRFYSKVLIQMLEKNCMMTLHFVGWILHLISKEISDRTGTLRNADSKLLFANAKSIQNWILLLGTRWVLRHAWKSLKKLFFRQVSYSKREMPPWLSHFNPTKRLKFYRNKAIKRNLMWCWGTSCDVEELDGFLDISCLEPEFFLWRRWFLILIYDKSFNPEAGGRLIDWEKRVNTVLKMRPGPFHDVDKKKSVNSTRK